MSEAQEQFYLTRATSMDGQRVIRRFRIREQASPRLDYRPSVRSGEDNGHA